MDLGNELAPSEVQVAPTVEWNADASSYYTLAMVDPDAPSRAEPTYREIEHWLVVNIPGDDISKGDVIAEYIGSGPPEGSGLHRYAFFLYEQSGKMDFEELQETEVNRYNFSIRKFAEKYEMGSPIAGNFYQAQYENILNKKFRVDF